MFYGMMTNHILAFFLFIFCLPAFGTRIDSLENAILLHPQIQEKVYVHSDNNSYFIGDTLRYKAYVLRSDNFCSTDISRILYVELLSPDGLVLKRHIQKLDSLGTAWGDFCLEDQWHSGYYEIRAYTRWQLNFNVVEHPHTNDDELMFYDRQHARDFFRRYEGLYSRVFPIYEKASVTDGRRDKYMHDRFKQHIIINKSSLIVSFYPEGGNLIEEIPNKVAFEVCTSEGEQIEIGGIIGKDSIHTEHMGRGCFNITPDGDTKQASFMWNGEEYRFSLPHAHKEGVAIEYDFQNKSFVIRTHHCKVAACSISCRGIVNSWHRYSASNPDTIIYATFNPKELTTGVNELVLYNEDAESIASRLFFVNNKDVGNVVDTSVEGLENDTLKPYRAATFSLNCGKDKITSMSVSIIDAEEGEQSYDDGNILTDLLLSSELKGFIANPAYYFESEDNEHQKALDLLMMTQGWRKYKRVNEYRYSPEQSMTFEGTVNILPNIYPTPFNVNIMNDKDRKYFGKISDTPMYEFKNTDRKDDALDIEEGKKNSDEEDDDDSDYGNFVWHTVDKGRNGNVKEEAIVYAESVVDGDVVPITTITNNGRYSLEIPEYYGKGILFLRAYPQKDSLSIKKEVDKDWKNGKAFPMFYVKRDVCYPVFAEPYSWYQVNRPYNPEADTLYKMVMLDNLSVSGKRSARGIKKDAPAFYGSFYDLYNDVTDRGLSWGMYSAHLFPLQATMGVFGNLSYPLKTKVRAMVDDHTYFRNYPNGMEHEGPLPATTIIYNDTEMKRIKGVSFYTDYVLRKGNGVDSNGADVTMMIDNYEDNMAQHTYRDRRYILDGYYDNEECSFYSPDYSTYIPKAPADYRRTLYWNPNAQNDWQLDVKRFFGKSVPCKIKLNACGIGKNGQIFYTR